MKILYTVFNYRVLLYFHTLIYHDLRSLQHEYHNECIHYSFFVIFLGMNAHGIREKITYI